MTTPPKRNARGEIRCADCGVYWPSSEYYSGHTAYCKRCERAYSRSVARMKYRIDPEYRKTLQARAAAARKATTAELQRERAERRRTVSKAIDTVISRGFLIREIAELTSTNADAVSDWRRQRVNVQPAVEARMLRLLVATNGIHPTGKPRPRGPQSGEHPLMDVLRARMRPVVAENPMYGNHLRKEAA